jgi:hypothetical protein
MWSTLLVQGIQTHVGVVIVAARTLSTPMSSVHQLKNVMKYRYSANFQ